MKLISSFVVLAFLCSCLHPTAPHVREARRVLKYGKEQGLSEGFKLLGKGGGMWQDVKDFYFLFTTERELTIEEARRIVVKDVENLLYFINTDRELYQYLHEYPFDAKNIEYSVMFRDSITKEIVAPPYLGGILLANGNIYYDYYYEQNKLGSQYQLLHKETFQEALKIVKHESEVAGRPY